MCAGPLPSLGRQLLQQKEAGVCSQMDSSPGSLGLKTQRKDLRSIPRAARRTSWILRVRAWCIESKAGAARQLLLFLTVGLHQGHTQHSILMNWRKYTDTEDRHKQKPTQHGLLPSSVKSDPEWRIHGMPTTLFSLSVADITNRLQHSLLISPEGTSECSQPGAVAGAAMTRGRH